MTPQFLTQSQRDRYQRVPLEISEYDLLQFFQVSHQDKNFLKSFNGRSNQIGVALQVCIVRFMGFIPDKWQEQIPETVASIISDQLNISIELLAGYTKREKTILAHINKILKYLGFRRWQPMDEIWLTPWLLKIGLEHDNEHILLQELCLKLGQERILRPSIAILERIVCGLGEQLHQETYRRLSVLLTQELETKLDAVLEIDNLRGMYPPQQPHLTPVNFYL